MVDPSDDQEKEFEDFLNSVDDDGEHDEEVNAPDEHEMINEGPEQKDRNQEREWNRNDGNGGGGGEGSGSATASPSESAVANGKREKKKDAKNDRQAELDQVEQVSYEARLAKMMLLSRKRSIGKKRSLKPGHKSSDSQDEFTETEFGPTLVMNDTIDNDPVDSSGSAQKHVTGGKDVIDRSALKDIMKQKKKKQKRNFSLDEDDAYWAT